jgi:dihydrofolate reductase
MAKLRVHNIGISTDGYMAGPNQNIDQGLGDRGEELHPWMFAERGEVDERFIARGLDNIGAYIMGRNMFGPIRGEWSDDWTGWWGDEPPYHTPVFVLTHYPRASIEMAGGTTFHFVTDGIESALDQAFAAAAGEDVRIGGGASTIQQYVRAGLVDVINVAVAPVLLGSGERLFEHLDGALTDFTCTEFAPSKAAVHIEFERK